MKKIIAISVMFVLIAGAAFADTSFGGNMRITANLASGQGGTDDKGNSFENKAGDVHVYDSNLSANWSGDNAGGMMRFHAFGSKDGVVSKIDWTPQFFGFVWWKPIDQFRLQIGQNADGDWGHSQISGWGYNAEAQNGAAVDQYRGIGDKAVVARTAAWWGGFGDGDTPGLALSFYPAQGFEINVGIPMASKSDLAVIYSNSKINVKADIPDIGTVRVAADLNKKSADADLLLNGHLGFYLSAVENMGIDIGFAFKQDGKDAKNNDYNHMEFGLGYRLVADDLTLKARIGYVMKDEDHGGSVFGIGIMPAYNLGDFKFFFNAGFGMNLDAKGDSNKQDWFVNPYIQVPTSAGSFYAGIKIVNSFNKDGDKKKGEDQMTWAIPIQWNVYY
jgi:hypothetical protein